jgi:hypothetical protein
VSFSLKNLSTDQLYDHLKSVWKRAQTKYAATESVYDFTEVSGQVNLLCARGFSPTALEPVETNSNKKWDDAVFVVWKEGTTKKVEIFEISTEQNTAGATAVLVLGAHQYWVNFHKKSATHKKLTELATSPGSYQYRALNPNTTIGVTVFRETGESADDFVYNSDDKLDPGNTTINIHYGGAGSTPTGWSAGCQVLRNWDRYKAFIKLVEADTSIKGTINNELVTAPAADGTRHVIYFLMTGDDLAPQGQKLALPVDLGLGHEVNVDNVRAYYRHTELEHSNGYFPLGTNTVWHGGVHVYTAKGSRVVACAPGRIVAARLGGTAQAANGELGSRNFILVRHELEAKPAPGAAPAPAPAPAPAAPSGNPPEGYKYTLDEGLALEKELREAKEDYGKNPGFNGYGGHGDSGDKLYKYVCTEYTYETLTRAGYSDPKLKERVNIWPSGLPSRHTGKLKVDSTATTIVSDDLKDKVLGAPAWIYITSGDGNGAVAAIKSFDASTGTLTLSAQLKKGSTAKIAKANDTFAIRDLEWSVEQNHDGTKGMVYALVQAGLGTEITKVEDLKPGDYVQYWYTSQGTRAGHAVQVNANKGNGKIEVHSSHGGTRGIDVITITPATMIRWYGVRPKFNPQDDSQPATAAAAPPAPPPPSGLAWYSLYMHLGMQAMMSDNAALDQFPWLIAASVADAAASGSSAGSSGAAAGSPAPGSSGASGNESREVTKIAGLYSHPDHVYVGEIHPGAVVKVLGSASNTHYLIEVAHNGTTIKLNQGKRDLTQVRFTKQTQYSKSTTAAPGAAPPPMASKPAVTEEYLAKLRDGRVMKVDVPVQAGEALWTTGEYGPPDAIEPQLHWGVFAAEELFTGFKQVEDTSDDFNMDCQQIMEMVEQSWFGRNDVLDAEEIQEFYRTNPKARDLRFYGCKFVCEWGVDLDAAIPKLKNVWFTYGIKEQVQPYMWWDEAAAAKCVLPSGKRVWHYNPIAAIAFLARVDFPPGSTEGDTLE